eukprot:11207049-Lingulodinium_polyedra.AAC.1
MPESTHDLHWGGASDPGMELMGRVQVQLPYCSLGLLGLALCMQCSCSCVAGVLLGLPECWACYWG